MKTILTFIAVLFVGCGESELEAENKRLEAELEAAKRKAGELIQFLSAAEETNKRLKDDLRRLEVVGTYEAKWENGRTEGGVFLENGVFESYENGKKREAEAKWTIINGEIHVEVEDGEILVLRINPDKSITLIANISDGEREDIRKEIQIPLKKIK